MGENVVGVLAMAYGTPASQDEIEAYYTDIRRGRKPSPEQLEDLIRRYQRIGGLSPLNEITRKQTEGLERCLNQQGDDVTYRVYSGMKHAKPFIQDTVKQMADDGIEQAVGIVFAPHYSSMSIGTYIAAAQKGIEQYGEPDITFIHQWYLEPGFLRALTIRLVDAFLQFPADDRDDVYLLFTAHSLPERITEMNDPYPDQLLETAAILAEEIGHSKWGFAWQSAGRTAEKWLGPNVLEVLRQLQEQGARNVIICPVGFVADHLEVLYDVDVECKGLADQLGLRLVRTASLNADEDFLEALAEVVRNHVKKD